MVWFSDFKDLFQDLSKDPRITAMRKESDVKAMKAEAAARASASKNHEATQPHPEPPKSDFRAGDPKTQLRQIVK
jgi:hypothetical protein